MPPKMRGRKRKAAPTATTNGTAATNLTPPDRSTWPGWVEMESEPVFFNAMLKDMGANGVKIQEVISMEPEMLAMLPQPVHGLIFLFQWRTVDEQQENLGGKGTEHIWFANQIPEFACATVALLNILNNIPGLDMGKEIRDFKDFTRDMSPLDRGQMIDNFEFVRRIHNSFASENDMLNVDLHTKAKYDRFKRKEAAAKARATKAAKKADAAQREMHGTSPQSSQASARGMKVEEKDIDVTSAKSVPARSTPTRSIGSLRSSARSTPDGADGRDEKSEPSSRKSGEKPPMPVENECVRRSTRVPKPRKDINAGKSGEEDEELESGYHFIAYMPVGDHVWKMDGLDYHPTDMGVFGTSNKGSDCGSGNWIDAISPTIQNRMLQFQDGAIDFSLMAVVHDPTVKERKDLLENIKSIQLIEAKLSGIAEDWTEIEGAETKKDDITGPSIEFAISQADIDSTSHPAKKDKEINEQENFLELVKLRERFLKEQLWMRANVRDSSNMSRDDEEKVRHRRHDYGKFLKGWLEALAENGILGELVND